MRCGTGVLWSHEECGGWDSPEDYFCDMCLKNKSKMYLNFLTYFFKTYSSLFVLI